MSFESLLLPLFVQVFLTIFLLFRLAYLRISAIRSGQVKINQIALGQNHWPEHVLKTDNCFHNQFETPILFYLLVTLIGVLGKTNLIFVILAWCFVGARLWHATEEITRNHVPKRFYAFLAGSLALLIMWLFFFLMIF